MKIGFIGLGNMGQPMARRLVDAGHEVTVYNRTRKRAEEVAASGAKVADTPAQAARKADAVITMLSDDSVVEKVTLGQNGIRSALGTGKIHVSMSTISATLTRRLEQEHASSDQVFLSATVLGRPEAAAAGELYIFCAGESSAREKTRPLFEVLGQRTFDLGDKAEAANIVKLSCNFLIASVIESISEAFALVRKAECIDPERFLEILTGTLFSGPAYQVYGKHVLNHDFKPGFKVPLALKDIELGLAAGKESGVPMPVSSLIRDHLISLIALGHGDLDWSALALLALQNAGMSPETETKDNLFRLIA